MVLFCRTEAKSDDRHGGFSQLILDMKSPGVTVRPILEISGRRTFNEVFFENVVVPDSMLLGQLGHGWRQVTSELSLERSGPDRFLSSFVLLVELVRALSCADSEESAEAIGRLIAHIHVLRQMSLSVAGLIQAGKDVARLLVDSESQATSQEFRDALAQTVLMSPAYSLRGGTREILRGMIARGLGLR
jgi:alkylation response protein AidB-like acyl-CoA dehydrogenase